MKMAYGCRYSETFSIDSRYSHLEGKRRPPNLGV